MFWEGLIFFWGGGRGGVGVVHFFFFCLNLPSAYVLDASLSAIERVLLLLLGCAVQCQNKELYINRIKELDLHTQQAIVSYIQKVRNRFFS